MAQTTGFTVWLTGLRGAGKSTLARYLGQRFAAVGRRVEVLDPDEIGEVLFKGLGTCTDDREVGVRRLGYVARLLTRNDAVALVASLSPLRDTRDQIRREVNRFVEVFVDCRTETLIERDTTGHYRKALAGELPDFTGITAPYETPQHAEVILHTDEQTIEESAQRILQTLVSRGYLSPTEVRDMIGKRLKPLSKAKPAKAKPAKAPAAKAPAAKAPAAKAPAAKAKPAKAPAAKAPARPAKAARTAAPVSKAAKAKAAKPARREPPKLKKAGKL